MIDTNLIKANSKDISERLKLRNYSFDEDLFANLEAQRKKYQTETEDLQAKRNTLSKEYGLLKKEGKDTQWCFAKKISLSKKQKVKTL